MSATTSGPVNMDQLHMALPGHVFAASGDLSAAGASIWAPNGDVTDTEIAQALTGIVYQASASDTAKANLQSLAAQQSSLAAQIQADATLFANTAVGSTLQADHLAALVRMVTGFATTMGAISDILTASGMT